MQNIVYKRQTPLLTVIDRTQPRDFEGRVMTSEADLASSGADTQPVDMLEVHGRLVAVTRRYVCISHVWSE